MVVKDVEIKGNLKRVNYGKKKKNGVDIHLLKSLKMIIKNCSVTRVNEINIK